jgi:hypothetical protein
MASKPLAWISKMQIRTRLPRAQCRRGDEWWPTEQAEQRNRAGVPNGFTTGHGSRRPGSGIFRPTIHSSAGRRAESGYRVAKPAISG